MKNWELNFLQSVFGTSALGNLFQALDYADKAKIVKECVVKRSGITK